MMAPASICASVETCARGEMPVSPVRGRGDAASGCRRRPIRAKACCGVGVTSTAMPAGTLSDDIGGAEDRRRRAAVEQCGVALALDKDEHALAAVGGGGDAGDLDIRMCLVDELRRPSGSAISATDIPA